LISILILGGSSAAPPIVTASKKIPSEAFGDRWYQVLEGTAKPKGHTPMRVRRRMASR